ncbi:MAG: DUF5615 family PIN-like protein [Nitrospirota bacterium]
MYILDENIPESQRQLLRSWRIHCRQIGHEIGKQGISDTAILSLLHKGKSATFFTRDLGFYKQKNCHRDSCLIILEVGQYEVASFIRRVLKHSHFSSKTKRMGRVVRITHDKIRYLNKQTEHEMEVPWLL